MTQRFSVTELAAKKTPQADRILAGLSPVALQLLIAGSQHPDSRPNTLHSENVACAAELKELEDRGLLRWIGRDPVVTPAGRAALDAPTEEQVRLARYRADHPWIEKLKQDNGGAMPPAKIGDHIPTEVYRNYRTMKMAAVPIVRMGDGLTANGKLYASRDGSTSRKFYIDPARMIDQPESRDDLILTLIGRGLCRWISETFARTNMLGVTPDLVGEHWTDADRKKWASLTTRAESINTRIRNGGVQQRKRLRYGDTA